MHITCCTGCDSEISHNASIHVQYLTVVLPQLSSFTRQHFITNITSYDQIMLIADCFTLLYIPSTHLG